MKKQKTTQKEAMIEEKNVFKWIAPEYIQHDKSTRWYFVAGAIAMIVVLISIFTGNWTMAIAIITLSAVYMYIQSHHPPQNIKIRVTEMGIYVGQMFFNYSNIEAFWILTEHGIKTLNLRVAKRKFTDVIIQLNDQDPASLRQYLVGQIPEWEGKHESFGDIILRLLKL